MSGSLRDARADDPRGHIVACLAISLLFFLFAASLPADAQADFVYFSTDLGTIPEEQALTLIALEGIVNRDAPRLYLNTKTLHPWSHENMYYFAQWDEAWLSVYQSTRALSWDTVTGVATLLGRPEFRPLISGLVVHDRQEFETTSWIAMTIAGIDHRLPVTEDVLAAIPRLTTWWPDVLDLRGRWTTKVDAYEWAISNYLADSSTHLAYLVGHYYEGGDPGDIMALDYAIAKGAFVFDLPLDEGAYPAQAALAEQIVQHLTPPAPLWGWYEECYFCDFAAHSGNYVLGAPGATNLSFHRHIPRLSAEPLQQTTRRTPEDLVLDPTKYYLAAVCDGADGPSRLTRFMEGGDWFDAARGQIPINWGLCAGLADEFGAMFEYFYDTATDYDYFITGTPGVGYARPSEMPNKSDYAALLASSLAAADMSIVVVWDYDITPPVWDPILETASIDAVIHDKLEIETLFFQGDHVPFFPSTFFCYEWGGGISNPSASTIAADIQNVMARMLPPAFGVIYGGGLQKPSTTKNVAQLLDSTRFEFLRMDEMTALARQIDHFHDVGTKYWAHDEVEACFNAGIVGGYSETHYRPTLSVSRDQMAVFISRALAGGDENVPDYTDTPSFPDVGAKHWALDYVEYAVEHNVVAGYDDQKYHPDWLVTRGQMAVFIARAIVTPTGEDGLADYTPPTTPTFPDVTPDGDWAWCYKHVEYIAAEGIASGYGDGYHPEYIVSRDQMAVYICRAFNLPM